MFKPVQWCHAGEPVGAWFAYHGRAQDRQAGIVRDQTPYGPRGWTMRGLKLSCGAALC